MDEAPADTQSIEPSATETAQPAPEVVETPQAETETQTAQIPASEPLPPELEPITPAPSPAMASAPASPVVRFARDLLSKARDTIQFRKHAKLNKILSALEKKNHITNDEVEKLLRVSDATATRYLSTLEKENKIKQTGKTGAGVVYSKI